MNKLKSILLLLILSFGQNAFSQNRIDSIKIFYVNPQITTPFDITCDMFQSSFDRFEIKSHTIIDSSKNIKYQYLLSKQMESMHEIHLDVRFQILIYSKHLKEPSLSICMDNFYMGGINNKLIKDKKANRLLKQMINTLPFH